MQTNVMHENNAVAQPLPEGQIDNDDEYEDEDHDNEIDMIELNTAYNRVMMLIEKVTDLYAE
jgi:hypothetical protein